MTILTLPTAPDFSDTRFGLVSNTQTGLESPLNHTSQFLELPGARWKAEYALPPMSRALAATWVAFLVALRGRAGQFYGFDPSVHPRRPRGSALSAGSLQVAGANQTGAILVVDGATPLAVDVFRTGDYLAYDVGSSGRQLHMVTSDATADSSGELSIPIEPPIRTSPAAGQPLILTDPSCVMRLVEDEVGWEVSRAQIYGLRFEAIEVFA